jgi:hypothetical protein
MDLVLMRASKSFDAVDHADHGRRLVAEQPVTVERGFSLIEGLIGAGILITVVMGLLPLFTRAMMDNTTGADYSKISNYARAKGEDFASSPLNSGQYQIQPGTSKTVIDEYFDPTSSSWKPVSGSLPPIAQWRRTTTVQQFYYRDLKANNGDISKLTPLDGSIIGDIVQAQILVTSVGVWRAGIQHSATMRYLKSF